MRKLDTCKVNAKLYTCQAFMQKNFMPEEIPRDTHERILEAAWSLIEQKGVADVTLADIAKHVGVSRQAVYLHFGNRAGLLMEMTHHQDRKKAIYERFREALKGVPPAAKLEAYIRVWCAYIPQILPVARALMAASLSDESARLAWQDRADELRNGARLVIERLAAKQQLAEGWTVAEATDWCWSMLHVNSWQQLVVESGWTPEHFTERMVGLITGVLVRKT